MLQARAIWRRTPGGSQWFTVNKLLHHNANVARSGSGKSAGHAVRTIGLKRTRQRMNAFGNQNIILKPQIVFGFCILAIADNCQLFRAQLYIVTLGSSRSRPQLRPEPNVSKLNAAML